jgi:FlaG/FlaF family flagellin (archaellin)
MKRRKSFNGNLKAVSPVIATIIIVAIAITMSIAVAYWLLGLGGSFTKFEKVEFTTAYVTGDQASGYTVVMNLKNTGTAAASVDPTLTLYNGKPSSAYVIAGPINEVAVTIPTSGLVTMNPGQPGAMTVTLRGGTDFVSGMTLEIMLHTTGGKDYPKVVTLP